MKNLAVINPLISEMENADHLKIRAVARGFGRSFPLRAFLLGLFVSPFLIIEFVMIPLVGQLLSILALFLTLYYLGVKRSWLTTLGGVLGVGSALLSIVVITSNFGEKIMPSFQYMMGLSTVVSVVYVAFISAVLVRHYELSLLELSSPGSSSDSRGSARIASADRSADGGL